MDTQPIIDVVKEFGKVELIREGETLLAVLPVDKSVYDLQPYLEARRAAPRRIETHAKATTADSLIDYLRRFLTPDSVLFADDSVEPTLTGIIDFHGQGADAQPRFGCHRVLYYFPVSDQLRAWSAVSGKALSHEEMASFVNDRQHDIANPPLDWMQADPATLELVLHLLSLSDDTGNLDDAALDNPGAGMTARDHRAADNSYREADPEPDDRYVPRSALYKLRQIRFGSAARLIQLARTVELLVSAKVSEGYSPKTGERTITFREEHETRDGEGRRVSVPDAFLLRCPIFEAATPQLIPVRLQYRRSGQHGIKWFLTLVEWRRVLRYAVRTEAERAAAAVPVPLFYGAPG